MARGAARPLPPREPEAVAAPAGHGLPGRILRGERLRHFRHPDFCAPRPCSVRHCPAGVDRASHGRPSGMRARPRSRRRSRRAWPRIRPGKRGARPGGRRREKPPRAEPMGFATLFPAIPSGQAQNPGLASRSATGRASVGGAGVGSEAREEGRRFAPHSADRPLPAGRSLPDPPYPAAPLPLPPHAFPSFPSPLLPSSLPPSLPFSLSLSFCLVPMVSPESLGICGMAFRDRGAGRIGGAAGRLKGSPEMRSPGKNRDKSAVRQPAGRMPQGRLPGEARPPPGTPTPPSAAPNAITNTITNAITNATTNAMTGPGSLEGGLGFGVLPRAMARGWPGRPRGKPGRGLLFDLPGGCDKSPSRDIARAPQRQPPSHPAFTTVFSEPETLG